MCRYFSIRVFLLFLQFLALAGCYSAANAAAADKTTSYISSSDSSWETLVQRNVGYSSTDGLSATRSQTVSPRMGYPAATIEQTAKMAATAVRAAGIVLARSNPIIAALLIAGAGDISNGWHSGDNGDLLKPAAGSNGQQPIQATGSYYRYCRNGACIWTSSTTSPDVLGAACAGGLLCAWPGQTVQSYHCWGNISSSVACEFAYKQGNDGPYYWEPGFGVDMYYSDPHICPGGMGLSGGMCSPDSSPVTDHDIESAVDSWGDSNAEALVHWLKQNGKWSPGNYEYDQAVKKLFGTEYVATKTLTGANGQQQTTTTKTRPFTEVKCSSSGCTITAGEEKVTLSPDGSTSNETRTSPEAVPEPGSEGTSSSSPSPNPTEIPDDYAREQTLQQVLDKLTNRQANPGSETCGVMPSCSGDAINCAILVEMYRNRCKDLPEPPDNEPVLSDVNVDTVVGTLSQTRWVAGVSCPADWSFDMGYGKQIVIPMQPLCDQASIIRPMVIAMALFMAAGIVLRGDS